MIVVGIPSKDRDLAGPVIKTVETFADKILVVSDNAKVTYRPDNLTVIEKPGLSLGKSRNLIFKKALKWGADFVYQIDDDLRFPTEVLFHMQKLMEENPFIGGLTNFSSVEYYWNRNLTSNKEWAMHRMVTAFYVIRRKALKEVRKKFGIWCELDSIEDIELGCKLWSLGWVCANPQAIYATEEGKKFPHALLNSRFDPNKGGQPIPVRNKNLQVGVEYLREKFVGGDDPMLKSVSLRQRKDGNFQQTTRYDYAMGAQRVRERWGELGYKDSKGREI